MIKNKPQGEEREEVLEKSEKRMAQKRRRGPTICAGERTMGRGERWHW